MSLESAQGSANVGDTTAASTTPSQSSAAVSSTTDSSTPQTTSEAKTADGVVSGAAAHGSDTAAKPYVANTKFKVKNEEKSFDDVLIPLVKDEVTEKKLRELYEKSHGIDFIKQERAQAQAQLGEVMQEHTSLKKNFERFQGYIEAGDMASFQKEAKIPDILILRRAQEILAAADNPQLRQAEEQRLQAAARMRQLEEENAHLSTNYQQASAQQRMFELNSALMRPDVSAVAAAFDARAGGQGAFMNEIIRRGQYYASVHQVDKSVEDILAEVMPMFSGFVQSQAQQTIVTDAGAQPKVIPAQKPVIPAVAGRGTSPVKKDVSSIADLKARARELAARA